MLISILTYVFYLLIIRHETLQAVFREEFWRVRFGIFRVRKGSTYVVNVWELEQFLFSHLFIINLLLSVTRKYFLNLFPHYFTFIVIYVMGSEFQSYNRVLHVSKVLIKLPNVIFIVWVFIHFAMTLKTCIERII